MAPVVAPKHRNTPPEIGSWRSPEAADRPTNRGVAKDWAHRNQWLGVCCWCGAMAVGDILISFLDTTTGCSTVHSFHECPVTMGSDPSNTLRLASPMVARRHAEIECTPLGLTLRSLVGDERTVIDGMAVSPAMPVPINDGAFIVIGPFRMTVLIGTDVLASPRLLRPEMGHATANWPESNAGLGVQDSSAHADGSDRYERRLRRNRELLMVFASAFFMANHYLAGPPQSKLATFRDAGDAVAYLTNLDALDRVNELADFLAELVTRIARLGAPVERWPA